MEIVNLTPHAINFVKEGGEIIRTIEPSGTIARLTTENVLVGDVDGIPIVATRYGEIEGLPEHKRGVIYVVSSLVAKECRERNDVYIPNEIIRDNKGQIVGCKSLGRI